MATTLTLPKQSLFVTTVCLALTRYCHCFSSNSNIPAIANYFGTKGRYEEVNPHLLVDILSVNKSILKPPSSVCTPIHLTAIIRHGTRYPTTKNIERMHRLYNLVVKDATSSEPWLEYIKTNWKMWYTLDMDGKLVEKGRDDHRHLAVRLAKLFPDLMSEENFRNNRIGFVTSSKHRCVDSIEAFQEGLHNYWKLKDVAPRQEVNDELMRFFDHCRRFVDDVEHNRSALLEVGLFKGSREMNALRRKMADRLQLPRRNVTADLVEAAFFLCSYEFAIKSLHSPWCNLFNETDAQVLEYKNDLKQYWKRGYGHDINRKSSCTLFHNLFDRLEQAAEQSRSGGEVPQAVSVQVGHGETLLPLLSLLGFFQDDAPLTAASFPRQRHRTFRTGRIVPYAANMLFVLYGCRGDEEEEEGPRLQFLLNERPLPFPGLDEPAPTLRRVRELYADLLQGCDFHKECDVAAETPGDRGNRHNHEL